MRDRALGDSARHDRVRVINKQDHEAFLSIRFTDTFSSPTFPHIAKVRGYHRDFALPLAKMTGKRCGLKQATFRIFAVYVRLISASSPLVAVRDEMMKVLA